MTRRRDMRAAVLALAVAAGTLARAEQAAGPPAGLDDHVARVMRAFEVPGLSLAIVKNGRTVVARGYGVRSLGAAERVDEHTLFGIASNTKVFTAVALGILVDEGKLQWDAPVIRYLPAFQLGDAYVTRELTVRDLLVHRSGLSLGAGDLLFWPASTYDRKEIVRRLKYIPLSAGFRSRYAYDNVLYLVAGEVVEAVSGQSWEDFVGARILGRVGMTASYARTRQNRPNIVGAHAEVDGKVQAVRPYESDNVNPAGGIQSSAQDMSRWLTVLLARGVLPDGARLVSERTFREITTWVTPTPNPDLPPELAAARANAAGYALGLGVSDYRGKRMLTHTGGLPGQVSRVTLLPEEQLGVVVLTNQESGEAFNAITHTILDDYLQAPKTDWVAASEAVLARRNKAVADAVRSSAAKRNEKSAPSLPLDAYAGTYVDAWYGDVEITRQSTGLAMRFTKTPELIGDLEHFQYDTFIVRWKDRGLRADAYITFALNPDGSIDQAKMRAVSPATDFSFDFHDLLLKPAARR